MADHGRMISTRIKEATVLGLPDNASVAPTSGEGLTLIIEESRSHTIDADDWSEGGERRETLQYDCFGYVEAADYPVDWRGDASNLAITGKLDDGTDIEVRGRGHVGLDSEGFLAFSFDGPPTMSLPRGLSD